jgi:hypothetical protein
MVVAPPMGLLVGGWVVCFMGEVGVETLVLRPSNHFGMI